MHRFITINQFVNMHSMSAIDTTRALPRGKFESVGQNTIDVLKRRSVPPSIALTGRSVPP